MTDYSKTVHLPKTSFPMKADLPKREPLMIEFWKKNEIYKKIIRKRKKTGKGKYILHDGPPYANGHIHMGHALNKILKDMIVKYKNLSGYESPYVPGWDCHGLPIEHQLMKELKKDKHSVDILDFRKKAAEFAMNFVEIQKKEFQRLGVFGDWENPYLTLTPDYENIILRTFKELYEKGYVYRRLKPVQWCPTCETALAEAEVEYEEKESDAIFVKFRVKRTKNIPFNPFNHYIIIWTTTPWTLPANVGLMLHPELDYEVIHNLKLNEHWIVAKNLSKQLLEGKLKYTSADYEVKETLKGKVFENWDCERVFPKSGNIEESKCFTSQQVSSEDGSGIVHIAPGHGEIDYIEGYIGQNLPILSPVNDAGKFSHEINEPELEGLFVHKKGNEKIMEMLGNKLVHKGKIKHSYPHCWRCKNPVIFRATHQWFLSVEHEDLRKKLLSEIENVQWIPEYGKNRIRGMVEQRPDWCLSRQRLWGTPIPVFYCRKCGHYGILESAINLMEKEGTTIWFEKTLKDLLSQRKCSQCKSNEIEIEHDIFDVWFDSGVSHEAVLKGNGKTFTGASWKEDLKSPADLYLEGSDQHRGWFQTSLIPSVALNGKPPYKAVLTHGFIVDGEGKKMSKSLGNVIAPEDILKEYGADILRLWVASSDYREDIRISKDILKGVAENYKKIRNTFRYIVGNIHDFRIEEYQVPKEKMLEIDLWALSQLSRTIENCEKAYELFEFHKVVVSIIEFCVLDCSSFYFDILKDRLYTYKKNSDERRSGQFVLYQILKTILPILSPILSFTSEEGWQLGIETGHWKESSVFLADFPKTHSEWQNKNLDEKWEKILKLREEANLALESARQKKEIGSSLEAQLIFSGLEKKEKDILKSIEKDLPMIFIVSQVKIKDAGETSRISVQKASGTKCARCWRYDETVKKDENHPELCHRCIDAIQ